MRQFASISFDTSLWEISLALCSGASLVMTVPDALMPGENLEATLNQYRITHFTAPPSILAPPISGLEQKLAAIWGNLLGLDASHSSIYDNFFLLPGRLMMSIIKGWTDICGSSMKKGPSLLGLLNSKRCVWEFRDQDVDLQGNNTKAS